MNKCNRKGTFSISYFGKCIIMLIIANNYLPLFHKLLEDLASNPSTSKSLEGSKNLGDLFVTKILKSSQDSSTEEHFRVTEFSLIISKGKVLDNDLRSILGFDKTSWDFRGSQNLISLFEVGVSDPVGESSSHDTDTFQYTIAPVHLG